MKNLLFIFIVLITLASCSESSVKEKETKSSPALVEGDWLLEFQLSETNSAPVNVIINKNDSSYDIFFSNAAEKIKAKNVVIEENNITIHDPLFNTWFEGEIVNPTKIEGMWYKNRKENAIPFIAIHGKSSRFKKPENLKSQKT